MLRKLFGGKNEAKRVDVTAPASGKAVPLSEVPDEAFAQGYMGEGAAIVPTEGRIVAPFDGKVSHLIDTRHAVIVEHASGLQLLIHIGINTVALKGEGFKTLVNTGDAIRKGQPLIEFDPAVLSAAGYSLITPVVVTSEEFTERVEVAYGDVLEGDPSLIIVHLK
jgi:PTS system glucose-specific IIA component